MPACGAGRERITESPPALPARRTYEQGTDGRRTGGALDGSYRGVGYSRSTTVGWSDCGCAAGFTPGTVCDPFAGAGTTAVMARRLGRRSLLVELNRDYCDLIKRRLAQDVLTFDEEAV